MDKVYIVHWKWSDNSGYGIIGVFDEQTAAEATFDALIEHGDTGKHYYLDDYPLNQIIKRP
jgi:hypothetical protein